MSEPDDLRMPDAAELIPNQHRRLLILMAVLGAVAAIAGAIFSSIRFGAGIAVGVLLAFVSYFWLRYSLKKVFESTPEGERPRISALRYLGRYFALGAVIAVIYVSDVLPIVPVILGMAAFGFAVVAEGLIQIFLSFSNRKDI